MKKSIRKSIREALKSQRESALRYIQASLDAKEGLLSARTAERKLHLELQMSPTAQWESDTAAMHTTLLRLREVRDALMRVEHDALLRKIRRSVRTTAYSSAPGRSRPRRPHR